jgi:hypothetical protein|nr:MAG TPA: PVL ORF-50-like family [Caudoviricetes sp.]
MGQFKNISGERFGSLTVISYFGKKNGKSMWRCKCDCGGETISSTSNLMGGRSTSCGCKRKKTCSDRMKSINHKHGGAGTRLFRIWTGMRTRCLNKKDKAYPRYGGRGITICAEWKDDFKKFEEWSLSNGYSEELTLDREDNNGPYSPDNCRWATHRQQGNNKRTNTIIQCFGISHTLSEWSEITGIPSGRISSRVKNGWELEKALSRKEDGRYKEVM